MRQRRISWTFAWTLVTFILSACNDAEKEAAIRRKFEANSNRALVKGAVVKSGTDSLAVLYLTEQEFARFPNGNNDKVVFQFFAIDTTRGRYSMIAWLGKSGKYSDSVSLHNDIDSFPLKLNLSELNTLTNQKLGKGGIKKVRDKLSSSNNKEIIAFIPDRERRYGRIFYRIVIYDSLAVLRGMKQLITVRAKEAGDTNPSPPADDNANM